MEHQEFISGLRAGQFEVIVDRSKALAIANANTVLPAHYQRVHRWWTAAWLLTLPAAVAAALLVKWWAGLLVVLFVTPALFRATNKRAMQSMIDYALEDGAFYTYALDNDVIRVHPKT